MLSLLLARAGVSVTLLEVHHDFDRDFRRDTIHPSTLEILDQIGLADRLHALPHVKSALVSPRVSDRSPHDGGVQSAADALPVHRDHAYIVIMPQSRFLEFLVEEARRYPTFSLVMGARVQHLLTEGGVGPRRQHRDEQGQHDVRA